MINHEAMMQFGDWVSQDPDRRDSLSVAIEGFEHDCRQPDVNVRAMHNIHFRNLLSDWDLQGSNEIHTRMRSEEAPTPEEVLAPYKAIQQKLVTAPMASPTPQETKQSKDRDDRTKESRS